MEHYMDTGVQTDPVVVLSLAQAAVLGLISQNQVFGATIAPNGFYTGEAKVSLFPQTDEMDYSYSDQLIGANGDYLPDPQDEEDQASNALPDKSEDTKLRHSSRTGPKGKGRRKKMESECEDLDSMAMLQTKQETFKDVDCMQDIAISSGGNRVKMIDLGRLQHKSHQRLSNSNLKIEHVEHNNSSCTENEIHKSEPQGVEDDEDEEDEDEGLSKPSDEGEGSPIMSQYFEPSEVDYESGEAVGHGIGEFDENSQNISWQEQTDNDGSLQQGRRAQIDRLDINVQIDESYCVDMGEGLKRWKCRMCEKSYTSKYNLVTHILGHSGIKPHECPRCGKLFKQPSHLQTHLLTHQGTRPHKCDVCNKAFTQTSHLKRHMLQHTDIKPYSCRFCGRGFAYPSELKAHETKHENGRCHVCVECGLDFPALSQLKRHLTSHQGPTTYQCHECNKTFHYRSQLQTHLMKHQNIRPFVCSECGMEFAQIHHLKQHSLTHKGVKEFKCDVCSREFTLSANLKRHMLIHASVRPYQCHVCFKTFVQKQTLKTHMIVHLPVKPFKCKVCGKSFNRMYNLLGHMHLHAGSKPFKCPYCSSKFNLKGNLSRHMKVKHGIVDLSLDGQDNLMDTSSSEHQEMEGQEDFEEDSSYDYTESETPEDNRAADISKLSDEALKEIGYYGFGKNADQYPIV
ncbi:zinc finger protein 710a [Polypterus senegalus]